VYAFQNHKNEVYRDDMWMRAFTSTGLSPTEIENITHDDYAWFHNGKSTCVGYGDWNERCFRNETYCAGGEVFGDASTQALAIAIAIKNGGSHPSCPLIY
jgi:hypothetical protein